jgi:hypothetical protein
MNQSFLTAVVAKLRGKSLGTFLHRWRRAAWERQLEKATEEALRLAEEYKRRTNRRP